ncbi:MAG TPA: glycine zipper domain-containing protein [Burkholderiaceae bacterium]|nr:glycine zipper domain-containing protein [Burkholderiaceae bacterium]
MKAMQRLAMTSIVALSALALGACESMSHREKSTAIGAGIGAAAGAAATGSTAGTVGGAAVGGVIGNQVGKDKR